MSSHRRPGAWPRVSAIWSAARSLAWALAVRRLSAMYEESARTRLRLGARGATPAGERRLTGRGRKDF